MQQKEREMQDLRQWLHASQEALAKLKGESQQGALNQSRHHQETIRELKERLEITNTDLQHNEKMALKDAQKISDLKTQVEAIPVANANAHLQAVRNEGGH
ncbi:GL18059 [Drosophila persimilis]|uniref:GL18059 n=1 Tax=Drosophila persimilis TaxID=7234 RepID=B4HAJ3_DROPE|nr:GL18059 [Drosophila persimilis]